MSALEEFSTAYEHTIAAFAAVGTMLAAFATVAAVLVSLHLARRSDAVRLRVVLGIGLTPTAPSAQHVVLQIDNIGVRVPSLSPKFFEWRIPFRRKHQPEMMLSAINTAFVIMPQPEINLSAVTNVIISEKTDFFYHLSQELPLIARDLKWFHKSRLKRLGAVIYANGDTRFKVKLVPVIEDEINSTIRNYLRQDMSRDDSTARRVAQ
jgi:hypothetical protein